MNKRFQSVLLVVMGTFCWILPLGVGSVDALAITASQTSPALVPGVSRQSVLPQSWQPGYKPKNKNYIKGPNVHRSSQYCRRCHGPGTPGPDNLLFNGDDIALCRDCHPKKVYFIHVVDIVPKSAMKIPKDFPLPGGKLTCVTCHDEPSCTPKDSPSWKRPFFLRGTLSGYDFCFSCHVAQQYKPYNPHDVAHLENQEAKRNNCLFCHDSELPDETRRGLAFAALKGKPNDLCAACHLKEPHFGALQHLNVKDEKALTDLAEKGRQAGHLLPLGENNEPLCVSCHDPHIPGLIHFATPAKDQWLDLNGSATRINYVDEYLNPPLQERLAQLEIKYKQNNLVQLPGHVPTPLKKLLRHGLPGKDSICLWCHDIFKKADVDEEKEDDLIYYVPY